MVTDDADYLIDFLKEFEARQRRSCLDKADTMMNEMKPQFEHFLKVFFFAKHAYKVAMYEINLTISQKSDDCFCPTTTLLLMAVGRRDGN